MLLCTACASPRVENLPCPVDRTELTCLDEPSAPDGHTDLEAAMYLIATRAAGADCRSKLQAVRETLEACNGPR